MQDDAGGLDADVPPGLGCQLGDELGFDRSNREKLMHAWLFSYARTHSAIQSLLHDAPLLSDSIARSYMCHLLSDSIASSYMCHLLSDSFACSFRVS